MHRIKALAVRTYLVVHVAARIRPNSEHCRLGVMSFIKKDLVANAYLSTDSKIIFHILDHMTFEQILFVFMSLLTYWKNSIIINFWVIYGKCMTQ